MPLKAIMLILLSTSTLVDIDINNYFYRYHSNGISES